MFKQMLKPGPQGLNSVVGEDEVKTTEVYVFNRNQYNHQKITTLNGINQGLIEKNRVEMCSVT